jgi:hypothetical protein
MMQAAGSRGSAAFVFSGAAMAVHGTAYFGKYLARYPEYYGDRWLHWCPACKTLHEIAVDTPFSNGARWSFNGDLDAPSFTPSVNLSIGPFEDQHSVRCHYFITAGKISFCGDCTHGLAGQTVDLPELDNDGPRAMVTVRPKDTSVDGIELARISG